MDDGTRAQAAVAGDGHERARARRHRARAGAVAGYAVSRNTTQIVHACYRVNADGTPARYATLRVVDSSTPCKPSERSLTWSCEARKARQGRSAPRDRQAPPARHVPAPAGPAGPQGPAAPASADCNLENRIAAAVPGFQISGACAPPPPCNDDGFEPNDTIAQATPIDLGTTTSAVACAGNDDFFAVPAAGGTVTASLTFDSTAVLDIALLDSSGDVAEVSGSSPQSVSTPSGVTGTVYVRIRAVGNAQGSYTLSV